MVSPYRQQGSYTSQFHIVYDHIKGDLKQNASINFQELDVYLKCIYCSGLYDPYTLLPVLGQENHVNKNHNMLSRAGDSGTGGLRRGEGLRIDFHSDLIGKNMKSWMYGYYGYYWIYYGYYVDIMDSLDWFTWIGF